MVVQALDVSSMETVVGLRPYDRITTRSPDNGAPAVRRYNARFGQSPNRRGGVTPVQRQGYPSPA